MVPGAGGVECMHEGGPCLPALGSLPLSLYFEGNAGLFTGSLISLSLRLSQRMGKGKNDLTGVYNSLPQQVKTLSSSRWHSYAKGCLSGRRRVMMHLMLL